MGKNSKRIATDGGSELGSNPFSSLNLGADLPQADLPSAKSEERNSKAAPAINRGRLDVRREKAGRGGKTVTVVSGFLGISSEEKLALAKSIQKRCGAGGAVKDGNIEIQGDQREEAKAELENAGFRVVFTGG